MYSILDVVNILKTQFPTLTIYPLIFPLDSPQNSLTVDISGTSRISAGNYVLNVQIKVRGGHPAFCETTSLDIRKFLEKKTNFLLGSAQVVLSESVNPYPLFLGTDETGDYLYSNNFRFIVNEGV